MHTSGHESIENEQATMNRGNKACKYCAKTFKLVAARGNRSRSRSREGGKAPAPVRNL